MKKIKPYCGNEGRLVLVTAMTSNKTGIGKTTISIGLADALNMIGQKTVLALREPSMGPVFGIKGGATGGGLSRIEPSDEINLHFTGDFHAIAQANNLLASIIDNHIFHGNELGIDTENIFFKRCLDINDRSLREVEYEICGHKIKTGFNITAASEVMAILSLSKNIADLKQNLGNILVALNNKNEPLFAKDLHAEEAMTILLKDAIKPTLVHTLGGTDALIHLGPFANIAHGCNSVIATQSALSLGDYCVTEAGFGSDLGAEKFLNIKSRVLKKVPDVVVLVVVVKVTKEHGNGNLIFGFENIKKHINNIKDVFGLNVIVAINQHADDSKEDLELLYNLCHNEGVDACFVQAFAQGGKGCLKLAEKVIALSNKENQFKYTYNMSDPIKTKIEKIAKNIYGAHEVKYSKQANDKIELAERLGMEKFFVNIAKTQFSFSDNKNMVGAPKDFVFNVTDMEIRSGAKMVVAIAGNMLLMPGLAKNSNYLNMKIDESGKIEGLF
ncbi:MAG: formate--tetrahydrofolate ligase [Clostridiales bacterium]|nr:formate--tetrahydrofolate ligase [Clostridiales bacterium]